jgi:hypothetical protein
LPIRRRREEARGRHISFIPTTNAYLLSAYGLGAVTIRKFLLSSGGANTEYGGVGIICIPVSE